MHVLIHPPPRPSPTPDFSKAWHTFLGAEFITLTLRRRQLPAMVFKYQLFQAIIFSFQNRHSPVIFSEIVSLFKHRIPVLLSVV